MYMPPLQRINLFNNLFRLFLTKSFVALLAAGTCNTANTSVADQLLLTLLTNTCSDLIAVASHVIITWNTCYAREKWTSSSRTTLWKGCGKQANGKSVNNLENDFIPVADVVKYLQWTLIWTIDISHSQFPKQLYSNHKVNGNQLRGVFIKNVLSFDLWKNDKFVVIFRGSEVMNRWNIAWG